MDVFPRLTKGESWKNVFFGMQENLIKQDKSGLLTYNNCGYTIITG